jgi:hypothetical protein
LLYVSLYERDINRTATRFEGHWGKPSLELSLDTLSTRQQVIVPGVTDASSVHASAHCNLEQLKVDIKHHQIHSHCKIVTSCCPDLVS